MMEDLFLYCLTLFTFGAVFFLCYIRRLFTFFERHRMRDVASTPRFPFGNMRSVVGGRAPLFLHLWKYYNRFRRKRCPFGGFYMLWRPAVVLADPELIAAALADLERAGDGDLGRPRTYICADTILARLFQQMAATTLEVPHEAVEEINLTQFLRGYIKTAHVGKMPHSFRKIYRNEVGINSFTGNFLKMLTLSLRFNTAKRDLVEKFLAEVVADRKKNDRREDDVVQILVDEGLELEQTAKLLVKIFDYFQTAVNLILFTLYELSVNDEVQGELREEILRFKRENSGFTLKNVKKLSYLDTVVKESLRKYPVEPFLFKRLEKPLSFKSTVLPKDILVFISVFGIHHDPQNYTNPELFDPDRFSEENEKFIERTKYIPFGNRSRNNFDFDCVSAMMKFFLVQLLWKHRFSLGKRSMKMINFSETIFELVPKDEMWLKVEKVQ